MRFVRAGSTRSLLAYAAAMLLALYTHYYALFLLAAQDAYLLLPGYSWLMANGRRGRLTHGAAARSVWLALNRHPRGPLSLDEGTDRLQEMG